jgi:glycosyltransferase involved in cell wall biosynthesis
VPEAASAPLRILHAPRNVANQAGHAAAGLRRRGHHVETWEDRPSAFGFPADRVLPYETKDPRAVWEAVREAVDRFDVLHFHFAQTLVPLGWGGLPAFWDLPLYRALGKRVFVTFHGTDVRVRRIHEAINPWSYLRDAANPPEDDRIEKSIEIFRTYADAMFAVSVNLLHFVPQATYLPRIFDLATWPEAPHEQRERPVIVHAPSRRETKGTDAILAALAALEAEGVAFELRLLEQVAHERVREEMAAADILVDNLNAGAYGVVSMEAMALGRVAIANLSDDVRAAHPDCPVVHVDPRSFAGRLRELIDDVAERRRLAELGRPFVARVHDADQIAARLEAAYTAPPGPVARLAMPGWMSSQPARRIEQLEERLGRAEMELARTRHREDLLRSRLDLRPIAGDGAGRIRAAARRVLPPAVRARLADTRRRGR